VEVDFEGAWFALKAHVNSKRSHGADELKIVMADLEVAHAVPEGQEGYTDRPMPAPRSDRPATAAHA
jgi:hypothetical protein